MRLTVSLGARSYPVCIERGVLLRLSALLPQRRRWAVIADENVAALYADPVLRRLPDTLLLTFPAGEGSKSLAVYESLCRRLVRAGFDRGCGVIALGGGVTGDLAGFVAATLLRGVALVQVPTSLLAMADSSVGGKTGLDLPEGKNLLGAFYQPRLVAADPDCLRTLPPRELRAGLAEIIKCGCIADETILTRLARDEQPDWPALIADACRVKAALVARDEQDRGERHLLNFGHTFGHVYEAAGGFSRWRHGEAVAAGMAEVLRRFGPPELLERLTALLEKFGLPTSIPCTPEELRTYLPHDKKADGDAVDLVVLERFGKAVRRTVPLTALLGEAER